MLHDEAPAAVLETSKGRRGTLRIGANQSINLYVMPQLTEMFRQFCPDVKVEVTCAHSDALLLSWRNTVSTPPWFTLAANTPIPRPVLKWALQIQH